MSNTDNNDPGEKKLSSEKSGFGSKTGFFLENITNIIEHAVKIKDRTSNIISSNALLKTPEKFELMGKAGKVLKDMRKTAGLSLEELSSVINIDNPGILKSIEEGHAALPVDLMLRLASFYSRNDPLPFIIRFSRTYHPGLGRLLEKTGIDRMFIKAERELKFISIYRNKDNARKLSDEGFDQVLDFTQKAFEMALHFVFEQENQGISENEDKNESKK
ncbi:helix-turn-helix transcriptional regulator [Desulfobacterales bacterium HSG17]|nr:helix-turn-helix transcriptional regulator [Desulfobacterales bacterium HSG17]